VGGEIDVERLRQKTAYVRTQIAALRARTADPVQRQRLLGDNFESGAVKYALQTAVEAIIDMAYHLAVKLCGEAPDSAVEAFQLLAGQGLYPSEDASRYATMARFRNKVVHGYGDVSPEALEEILTSDLDDFEKWLGVVRSVVGEGTPES
jgi:uncharacterized protein YutE (UPF0331/DUF86 family)